MRADRIEELSQAGKAFPLLADLAPKQLSKLLALAEQRSFEQGEIIFGEGARRNACFDRLRVT
jgi:hypothetical protein